MRSHWSIPEGKCAYYREFGSYEGLLVFVVLNQQNALTLVKSSKQVLPICQYLKASVLIAGSFDLVICFHWLRTVTSGAFLLVNIWRRVLLLPRVLILYPVHEDVLVYFYWLRTVTTGAFLLVNTWRRVRSLPRVLILYMRLSLSTFIVQEQIPLMHSY